MTECEFCGKKDDTVEPFLWRASSIALLCESCINEILDEYEEDKDVVKLASHIGGEPWPEMVV